MPLPLMADGDLPSAIQRRDWAAAKTILHLSRNRLPPDAEAQWRVRPCATACRLRCLNLGTCHPPSPCRHLPPPTRRALQAFLLFHSGAADAALEVYASLAAGGGDKSYELHQAACLFHLRRYPEAQALVEQARLPLFAQLAAGVVERADSWPGVVTFTPLPLPRPPQGPDCALRTRLLAHCAAKAPAGGAPPAAEAQRQAAWEAELGGSRLDQLSLAALLYDRGEHEGAARVYARLLQEFPDLHALRMYLVRRLGGRGGKSNGEGWGEAGWGEACLHVSPHLPKPASQTRQWRAPA